MEIQHDQAGDRGAFYLARDGERLAELAYRRGGDDRVVIVHTEVDDSLRGQGVARKLLDAAVTWARETGTKLGATCPYAKAQLEKDATLGDVYAPSTPAVRGPS